MHLQALQHLTHESLSREEKALELLVSLVRATHDAKITAHVLNYMLGEVDDLPKVRLTTAPNS